MPRQLISKEDALAAYWGKSSNEAAQAVPISSARLRRLLSEEPLAIREAFRLARLARQIRDATSSPTAMALGEALEALATSMLHECRALEAAEEGTTRIELLEDES